MIAFERNQYCRVWSDCDADVRWLACESSMCFFSAEARTDSVMESRRSGPRANIRTLSPWSKPALSSHRQADQCRGDLFSLIVTKWRCAPINELYFDIILRQKPFRWQRPDTGKMLSRVRWISSPTSSYNLKQRAELWHWVCRNRGRNFAEICTSCWQECYRHALVSDNTWKTQMILHM